ncbi:nicotinamidase PWA37_005429 [Arxiozyma heterogenica]|uniref:nicotinamidase n=1 Tax=Arxiozyma heterogenica TaxID=278026 RepID=UPI002F03ED24
MKALLVIDVQNDFARKDGKLYVNKGEEIVEPIVDLIEDKAGKYKWDLVVLTRDWHPADHISFAKNHNLPDFSSYKYCDPRNRTVTQESTLWPVHCVQNTWGGQLVDPLNKIAAKAIEREQQKKEGVDVDVVVVDKGYLKDREYYSAFNDIWDDHKTELDGLLRKQGIEEVFVVGLALDYCVKNSAVSSARLGYKTTILTDFTRAIATDHVATETLRRELDDCNVRVENL